MFTSARRFANSRAAGVLSGAICATVFTAIAGTTLLVENEKKLAGSPKVSSSITWACANPIRLVTKNLISVSECHAAGDSCCKETTTNPAPVVATKPKEAVSKVVEVTTESFEQVVLNSDKDVFVVFYAPWCGYCKRLVPVWQDLAEESSGTSSVVIAQVDMTQYSVNAPGVAIRGYPTIYLFKNGRKEAPIEYRGARDVDSFAAFLEFYTNM